MKDYAQFLRTIAAQVLEARLSKGARVLDASDLREWLIELAEKAEQAENLEHFLSQICAGRPPPPPFLQPRTILALCCFSLRAPNPPYDLTASSPTRVPASLYSLFLLTCPISMVRPCWLRATPTFRHPHLPWNERILHT